MALQPYLNFNGNCLEVVKFYASIFGTMEPRIMFFGDAPAGEEYQPDEATKKLVMHAEIEISGTTVMFSDVPPGMPFVVGNNISLVFGSTDMDELRTIFSKLKEGGNVVMELQQTFWSKCYGYVIDRFGIGWQLSYPQEMS